MFSTLSAIAPLAKLPALHTLILAHNAIASLASAAGTSFPALARLELPFNAIRSFPELDELPAATPALSALRITHNPLYDGVRADDAHMLTVARLPARVTTLNHSIITAKERENAELWYMSGIARQLAAALTPEERFRVLGDHRRWSELCALHGEPVVAVKAGADASDTILAAKLVEIEFVCGEKTMTRKVPCGTSVSVLRGLASRWFGVAAMQVCLVAQKGGERVQLGEVGDTKDIGLYLDVGKWKVLVESV